jgi:hypothetical protein
MTTVPPAPTARGATRQALLAAVAQLRGTLEAYLEASEAAGTLAQASVEACQAAGLYGLKLPTVLGGFEADPLVQIDVIEAVSRIHPTAGWNLFICGTGIGLAGAFLPPAALPHVFTGSQTPIAAGVLRPWGQATPVAGGYRVCGRWPFASGIRNATWFCGGTTAPGGETRMVFVPVSQVTVHDTWQVFGLQGTGSCDVEIEELFVRLCRKMAFSRQNPKIVYWKINNLRVQTFLFSVICDRATERPPIRVGAVDAGRVVAELAVTRVAVETLVPTTCAGALCCNGTLLCAADVAGGWL